MVSKIFIVAVFTAITVGGVFSTNDYFQGIERLSLHADRSTNIWTAYGVNSTGTEISVPATVPGGIYSDLEDNGVLESPIYHEYNDMENRWVGRTNWTFSRTFTVSNQLLQKEEVVLVCEGLDTVSEVFVNEVSVGKSENMFVRYNFNIKDALKVGENTIKVAFVAPVIYAETEYYRHIEEQGYDIPPDNRTFMSPQAEDRVQMMRKMQSSFSWDWGPSYPSSGIWKDIFIEGYSRAIIRDVMIFTKPTPAVPTETEETEWEVTVRVYYDSVTVATAYIQAELVLANYSLGTGLHAPLKIGKGNSVDLTLTEKGNEIKLWWPNGYGEQNLHVYNVSLTTGSGFETEYSSRKLKSGFRTVELVEDLVDPQDAEKGREFYFRVNGVKIYSKGSNAIPLHVLPERVTEKQLEWLLRSAKKTHQNMIRVWGGGVYESERFFDWADEYGILIWQDFMFACAMYPVHDEFLATVREEVETQVKRLQHRASLAMWAGNNENEIFLVWDFLGTSKNFTLYYNDYVTLYADTLKVLTEKLDPSRTYLISSPTNGLESERSGWVHLNPLSPKYGDIHWYNYQADNWDINNYLRPRFASEYGFNSYPHYETLAERADDITKWTFDSPQLAHRQRHGGANDQFKNMIQQHFPYPTEYNSPEALPYMLYLVELTQIMGQKIQVELYRRYVDKMNEEGIGHNMGALYWQLNDIWEGASWGSVEVNGRWKLQMYYTQKFFAPVLASPYRDNNGDVIVELVSDLPNQNVTGQLRVQVFKLTSMTPVFDEETTASTGFLRAPEVFRIENSVLENLGCASAANETSSDTCVVYLTYSGYPDNFLFLQYPKNKQSLKDPNLMIENVQGSQDGHEISFTLTTKEVAPFVYLNVRGEYHGYFSDNGFLQTTTDKQLTFYSEEGITPQQFLSRVEFWSLFEAAAIP